MINIDKTYSINLKDKNRALNTAVKAFKDYPLYTYLFPKHKRESYISLIHNFLLIDTIKNGCVFSLDENVTGLIELLPPGKTTANLWRIFHNGGVKMLINMNIATIKKLLAFDEWIESNHKKNAPMSHYYLRILAVDPACQQKGIGTLLVKAALSKITKDYPVYLETHNEKNILFYKKFGFKITEEVIIPSSDNIIHYSMIMTP